MPKQPCPSVRILTVLTTIWAMTAIGCCLNAYTNQPLSEGVPHDSIRAALDPATPRGKPRVLVALALSGGGSRAAYLGAAVMLKIEEMDPALDLLKEVDVISAVSGGALPAAFYCVSKDRGAASRPLERIWMPDTVRELMSRDYEKRWFGNWFWPVNIIKYWFTSYDRSDIMAQTFQDNLFDRWPLGLPLTLGDLDPARPYLVINATDGHRRRASGAAFR